jgi:fructokinase
MVMTKQVRPIIFGEVLFDQFPDGSIVLGGAPFNVAWHLQALGLAPLFVSRVGKDKLGSQIRARMQDWGMDLSALQEDARYPTGTVRIEFNNGEPAFEILSHQAYDFIDSGQLPPLSSQPVVYHGSLALRHSVSRASLQRLLENAAASVFMDVNLRVPWWEKEQVITRLKIAHWAKLNEIELSLLSAPAGDLESQARRLQEDCDLEILIVTRGSQGAFALSKEGRAVHVTPHRSISIVDTVGAGDAFSAVMLFGLIRHWELELALQRAQSFATAVVGIRGATPHNPSLYNRFISEWSPP